MMLMMENRAQTGKAIDTLLSFPTYDLCKLRGIQGIEEIAERAKIPYKTNKSDYSVHLQHFGTVLLRSYERPERIVAFEVGHSVLDELDTLPKGKASLFGAR